MDGFGVPLTALLRNKLFNKYLCNKTNIAKPKTQKAHLAYHSGGTMLPSTSQNVFLPFISVVYTTHR